MAQPRSFTLYEEEKLAKLTYEELPKSLQTIYNSWA